MAKVTVSIKITKCKQTNNQPIIFDLTKNVAKKQVLALYMRGDCSPGQIYPHYIYIYICRSI